MSFGLRSAKGSVRLAQGEKHNLPSDRVGAAGVGGAVGAPGDDRLQTEFSQSTNSGSCAVWVVPTTDST